MPCTPRQILGLDGFQIGISDPESLQIPIKQGSNRTRIKHSVFSFTQMYISDINHLDYFLYTKYICLK